VYLDRGTPAAGSLGSATIPQSRTSNQVEVEDVVGVFRDGARTGLQAMPGEFGQAFRDAAPPARAFGTLAAISPAVATGVHGLRGQSLDSDLRTMVAASASTVQALDTPTEALRTLIAAGAATLESTAASQADIRSMIAQGPGTLQSTGVTVRQLDTTLTLADPLIARLSPAAPDVAPTLARLHPTVVGLDQLLHRAVPLLHALRPAVTSLAHAADAGLPLLTGFAPTLYRTGRSILPSMSKIDPETKHSAAEMIGGTFTGVGSGAAAQEDANGHFIRFPVSAGSSSTYLPCQIYYGNPDKKKLAECQTLQQALQTFLTWVNSQVPGGPR
jgi:ABC-type transporter Mla subunit MlaD